MDLTGQTLSNTQLLQPDTIAIGQRVINNSLYLTKRSPVYASNGAE